MNSGHTSTEVSKRCKLVVGTCIWVRNSFIAYWLTCRNGPIFRIWEDANGANSAPHIWKHSDETQLYYAHYSQADGAVKGTVSSDTGVLQIRKWNYIAVVYNYGEGMQCTYTSGAYWKPQIICLHTYKCHFVMFPKTQACPPPLTHLASVESSPQWWIVLCRESNDGFEIIEMSFIFCLQVCRTCMLMMWWWRVIHMAVMWLRWDQHCLLLSTATQIIYSKSHLDTPFRTLLQKIHYRSDCTSIWKTCMASRLFS